MARITVFISDDVLEAADFHYLKSALARGASINRSHMVTEALKAWSAERARPEASQRGRTETLRSVRAAQAALRDVEAGLTQAKPVRRSVRRYAAPARRHHDT